MPQHVEKLVLLAPDGLNFNFLRWLGTNTLLGNQLLHHTIHHPSWALWVINKAEAWKVIHKSMANYVRFYIEDTEYRTLVYHRYISMRKFNPSLSKLKRTIKKYRIPVKMMFGTFDRVIPAAGGEKFREGIEEFATLQIVEAGHNLLSEVQAGKITQLIQQ